MASTSIASRARPLLVRPGARFTCFGDGLCCTDVHVLGSITRKEASDMRRIARGSVHFDKNVEGYALQTVDHHCFFLGKGGCHVHAKHGADAKPLGCRRFPYGLVNTAGRTRHHRAPLSVPHAGRTPTDRRQGRRSLTGRQRGSHRHRSDRTSAHSHHARQVDQLRRLRGDRRCAAVATRQG
jgi:Fe-S-cluster containining protein